MVGVTARDNKGLDELMDAVEKVIESPPESSFMPSYSRGLEEEILKVSLSLERRLTENYRQGGRLSGLLTVMNVYPAP